MKLTDTTLAEVVEKDLTWKDFEETDEEVNSLMEDDRTRVQLFRIVNYLDEQKEEALFERGGICKLDFYSTDFSVFGRLAFAKGHVEVEGRAAGAVDYALDYSELQLIMQILGGGLYAVYLKDYSFGYMKPFGECVYDFMDIYDEMKSLGTTLDPEGEIEFVLIPGLEREVKEGNVNLAAMFYDYYHDIPNIETPGLLERLNDDLISVQEAARMLDVSSARVKRMIADHVIDGFKRNGKLWISREAIQQRIDYIEKNGKPTRGKARN